MRVPDLDWPVDLFACETPHDDRGSSAESEAVAALWPAMQEVWMRRAAQAPSARVAA